MLSLENAIAAVNKEIVRANNKFPLFKSQHEGYAVLLEEVDELWDSIKLNERPTLIQKECIQVAAMAIKMLISDIW
jgi:hypothetical protein